MTKISIQGIEIDVNALSRHFRLGKPQKVFKITNTQNCGFLQVKAGFAQFHLRKISRFYLTNGK
jgi:hypothetical protein